MTTSISGLRNTSLQRRVSTGALAGTLVAAKPTIANNAGDATNDIDFGAGAAIDSTGVRRLVLAAMTKQLDAAWAAGTNAGGRMSAAGIADTTYHCHVIGGPGVPTDCGFDVSAGAPTLPTGYSWFRRIGSIIRASNNIRTFRQLGDRFWLVSSMTEASDTAAVAEGLLTLTAVPAGLKVRPLLTATLSVTGAGDMLHNLGDGDAASVFGVLRAQAASSQFLSVPIESLTTDTTRRIRRSVVVNSGTLASANLVVRGWIDDRGGPF